MTRRSFPRIPTGHLRDHADEARIARVWDRIEHDLGHTAPSASRRAPAYAYFAVAAAFAAFGVGVLVGKSAFRERGPVLVAAAGASDPGSNDVLAAGTAARTFALPGGGQTTLQPGAIVELNREGGALKLKLVQGEASVDGAVGASRSAGLAILADEARVDVPAGGALTVRRSQDEMDVSVREGTANVTSPAGLQSVPRGERVEGVPTRTTVSSTPTTNDGQRAAPGPGPGHLRRAARTAKTGEPEWLVACEEGRDQDVLGIFKKLKISLDDAIRSARSARELMTLGDFAAKRGEVASAIAAYERVTSDFEDDQNARYAARKLALIYEQSGQFGAAGKYYKKILVLAPGSDLAKPALCGQIRALLATGHNDEAARAASEYVDTYSDGACKQATELVGHRAEDGHGSAAAKDEHDGGAGFVAPAAPAGPAALAPIVPAPATTE